MIKRRFYKEEHGDNNGDSATSSSSSDDDSDSSSSQQHEQEQHEEEDEEVDEKPVGTGKAKQERDWSQSTGSGYEIEDSSGNEFDCDSSDYGLPINENEENIEKDRHILKSGRWTDRNTVGVAYEERYNVAAKAFSYKDPTLSDSANCIIKCKSVFKCKLCPRIICLSEDTLKAHLLSKKHARSKKLLSGGRLKLMLNSDGEIEEDQETHAERHARTMTAAEGVVSKLKKNKGRQRQRQRARKKLDKGNKEGRVHEGSTDKPKKKRRKSGD